MNPWDIDPNLYLPLFQRIFRSLRWSFRSRFAALSQARSQRTAPPAGCRG